MVTDEGEQELADVIPLPGRTEAEPLTPAELAALMSGEDGDLADAMRRAFGMDEQ